MNMVGTPYSAVHFSSCTARRDANPSKLSAGKTIAAPCVAVAMYPKMLPKQWNSGGGQQTMSRSVNRIRSPIWAPLLRIERCVRHAALGREVVPEVNWMLTMS